MLSANIRTIPNLRNVKCPFKQAVCPTPQLINIQTKTTRPPLKSSQRPRTVGTMNGKLRVTDTKISRKKESISSNQISGHMQI
jgi:hypothetical protein